MDISVIVPVYNKIELIGQCLKLNIEHCVKPCEWIIIDNDSDLLTKEGLISLKIFAEEKGHVFNIITETYNTGVAVAWNKGLRNATSNFVCILNNDCIMMPEWDAEVRTFILKNKLDIFSPLVIEPKIANHKSHHFSYEGNPFLKGNIDWSLILKRNRNLIRKGIFGGVVLMGNINTFRKVGAFDETFWLSLEEMDFLIRAQKAGLQVGITGSITAFHYGGATRNTMKTDGGIANVAYFKQKWGWDFEKTENTWYNKLIRSWQKKTWKYFHRMSTLNFILPS